jgi:archaellum component FlaF (FlaF/FlaG flagellin family)
MGFASIGAFIMLFFSLIIVISAFAMIQGRMVESTQLTIQTQQERLEQSKTEMEVVSISYDALPTPDNTTIVLNNTGQNKIELAYLDVFIDNVRLPRDSQNRTLELVGNAANPLHWDPGEGLRIDALLDLSEGSHMAVVSTEYGRSVSAVYTT